MGAVYLIRHGQASFGQADYDALSGTGVEQSRVLGEALRTRLPQVDLVLSGTMRRHRQTADACLAAMRLDAERLEQPGFNEYDHDELVARLEPRYADHAQLAAELAGTPDARRAFQALFGKAMERWMSGRHDAEYSESWSAFQARCSKALEDLVRALGASRTALVFTSGGPISAICQKLLGIADAEMARVNWTMANCGVTKLIYSERSVYLSTLNEHSHFEGARRHLITYR
ncbi:MAG: histidine phosphatase family protein [Nevskia sp.]|nr:histidine phosphatase family protein [Nevskia sp.]